MTTLRKPRRRVVTITITGPGAEDCDQAAAELLRMARRWMSDAGLSFKVHAVDATEHPWTGWSDLPRDSWL